jgi:hypothetical protein
VSFHFVSFLLSISSAKTRFLSLSTTPSLTLQLLCFPLALYLHSPIFCDGIALFNAPEFTEYVSIFTVVFVNSSSEPEDVSSCWYPLSSVCCGSCFCILLHLLHISSFFSAEMIIASKFTTFPGTVLIGIIQFCEKVPRKRQLKRNDFYQGQYLLKT